MGCIQTIQFVTSNYVFAETVTVLSQRVSKSATLAYMESMTAANSPFQIKRASEMLDELTIQIFRQQTSKNTSLVDCTNMAFIQQFHLDAIFSFDQVYKTNKLTLLEDWLTK